LYEIKSKLKNRKPLSIEAVPGKPFPYFLTQNQNYDLNGTQNEGGIISRL